MCAVSMALNTAARQDSTARLPPELKLMICTLLPNKSLKDACFINKSWGFIAASMLWRTFVTDFAETETRNTEALLLFRPGGFLDSIRNLRLSPTYDHNALSRLFSVLPRACLIELSAHDWVEKNTLGACLRTQPKLKKLYVPTSHQNSPCGPPDAAYTAHSLKELQELTMTVHGHSPNSYEGYLAWFPHLSELRNLKIQGGFRPNTRNHLSSWDMPVGTQPLKLYRLSISGVVLPETPATFIDSLQLDLLTVLQVWSCCNPGPLMRGLSQKFIELGHSSLKALDHFSERQAGNRGTEELLDSVDGLKRVYVTTRQGPLVAMSCLTRQGLSLRLLKVSATGGPSNTSQSYSSLDFESLAASCPNIELLSIGLVSLDLRRWTSFEPLSITPATNGQLFRSLEALARLPKLHTLRLTHKVFCGEITDPGFRRMRYEQLVNSILRILVDGGSPIQVLVIIPATQPAVLGTRDTNGHCWPRYYYRKGMIMLPGEERQPAARVIAVPISSEDTRDLDPRMKWKKDDLAWAKWWG
ncbi:hypothetical protein EJ02DRAFT_514242 [Clathrospora elynae]|uniref:F-box domain-containing protein n=1 Tax=Clathrospora elynae TaxID=706981 RepID=A0A6A5SDY3_9PLEO|nr:hypothetical protein EJ02DRAFT_514242 [Clathrospora elynae]